MRDAVIVEAVRTPLGKRNGALSGVHPVELSAHVLKALVERVKIDATTTRVPVPSMIPAEKLLGVFL